MSSIGVGSLPELDLSANSTTPPTDVTDWEGLAVAEEHQRDADVFSIGGTGGSRLRFDGSVYFLSCAGVSGFAAVCFVALRCCCYRPHVHSAATANVESQETGCQDANISTNPSQLTVAPLPSQSARSAADSQPEALGSSPSTSARGPISSVTTVLDDGTERQSSVCVKTPPPSAVNVTRASTDADKHKHRRATVSGSPAPDVEARLTTSTPAASGRPDVEFVTRNRRHVKPLRFRMKSLDVEPVSAGRPKLFRLLIVIVVWTSAVVGGPLSTVMSYACYPVGSRSFVAGAVVADVMAALACVAAARATPGRGDLSTVIAMTCLGTIVLVYYTALVLFSLQPQPQQQLQTKPTEMPLFGSTAEMLTVSDASFHLTRDF